MIRYMAARILRWSSGLLIVLFVSYAMMFFGGGDPVKRMFVERAQTQSVDEEVLDKVRAKYGLDEPFLVQFGNYLNRLIHGDLGISITEQRPVVDMVRVGLPISMQLGLAATVLLALVGIPLGVVAALHHERWADSLLVGGVVIGNAVPVFVTGPMLVLLFAGILQVMEVPFGWKGLFNSQVILPVTMMALVSLPIVVRQTRAGVLEVINQDYIRTAYAKGLPKRVIVLRHILRPVLTPVVSELGLIMIGLINGAIFVELIFNIPGFGRLTLEGLSNVDYPIIMSSVLVGGVIVIVSNLLVDLLYPLLDPRLGART